MPILTVTVENPDELLNASFLGAGALGRVERSATGGGLGYSEISTFAIVAGTRSYTVYDLAGAATSWYRLRYTKLDGSSPSSYGAEFQTGDETAGLICAVHDVEQELGTTLSANDRENVLDKIRQVTAAIEGYCERWFVPRPLSGTATYRVHTGYGQVIRFPKGIRSLTSLSYATTNQPASGGTYTPITDFYLDPPEMERSVGWPATAVRLINGATLYNASYGAEAVGAFGFASVPHDIQGVGIRAVVRRHIGKGGGGAAVAIGPEGQEFLLPDLSGADRRLLEWYRHRGVG